MTISISPRFGLTVWDSDDDQVQREQFSSNFEAIEALGAQCTIGGFAQRPAPGGGQRFYYATDQSILYYDTGSAWKVVLFTPDSEFTTVGRPAAGADGRYVYETDARRLYRDTGSRYLEILTSTVIPAGVILPTVSAVLPPGWLVCDGAAYPPGQYPDLHAAIGFRYGTSGPNFRVPDFRSTFLAGAPSLGAGGYGGLGAHDHGLHAHSEPSTGGITEHICNGGATFTTDASGWYAGEEVLPAGYTKNDVVAVMCDAGSSYDGGWHFCSGAVDFQDVPLGRSPNIIRVVYHSVLPNDSFTSRLYISNGAAGLAGETGSSAVSESANLLTYGYASFLIKATGGPHD